MDVRTRIAPSPTGIPHLGTAYVALFNLCFARLHKGKFILRIEDTDQQRNVPGAEASIIEALSWLGLDWDEGPDKGGPYASYRQSERKSIYRPYAEQLVEQGDAFYCFATPAELKSMRDKQLAEGLPVRYDGRGLELPSAEVTRRIAGGEPHVIRMKIPTEGECTIKDQLRGNTNIAWSQVDMQILLKADGMPTYHFASVVDDYLMGITHVLRGEEWLSSAPKHQLLYHYFSWQMPKLYHLPLLRNPDKSKLSKRKNPVSIGYYRAMGYLPEALINYLGRLGWSFPDEREKFSLQEMLAEFDPTRIVSSAPIFDLAKLDWLNGAWLREELSATQLTQRLTQWAFPPGKVEKILQQLQPRMTTLSDVVTQAGFLFSGKLNLAADNFSVPDQDKQTLQFILWRLETLWHWQRAQLFDNLSSLAKQLEIKLETLLKPAFIAITGSTASMSLMDGMELLGRDLTLSRLRQAIEVLGGVSKRQTKEWQKVYQKLEVDNPAG